MAKSFTADAPIVPAAQTRFNLLGAISFSHFLNDMMQSLIVAIYPLLKGEFHLNFVQIGSITLTYQAVRIAAAAAHRHLHRQASAARFAQRRHGLHADRHVTLAFAPNYASVLAAAALIGAGSAIFHPESSRIARLASGGRLGLAQSIFQVGGNAGQRHGPLLAAWIIIPQGQTSLAWFALAALLAIVVLWNGWAPGTSASTSTGPRPSGRGCRHRVRCRLGPRAWSVSFSSCSSSPNIFIVASISSYYSFYLIEKFHVPVRSAQVLPFRVSARDGARHVCSADPLGDRIGRKRVIWFSILGVAPFTLILPYVGLAWTGILSFLIG